MCGLLIVAASGRDHPSVDERTVARMRDRMVHRGPDGAGLLTAGAAILAHRRLAVIDPEGGPQPWVEPPMPGPGPGDGAQLVLVYNGELYEAEALRGSLPGTFRSRCDTEVLARLLQVEGMRGLDRVRGMFAFAAWWPARRRMLLARDPLGIKPLQWSIVDAPGGPEVIAASEPAAILDHPWMRTEPDWATVSAYLTTIRLTLDDRTMYAGVRTVRPGERIEVDLSGPSPRMHHALDPRLALIWPAADPADDGEGTPEEILEATADRVGDTVRDSITAHALADVPVGAMLSGGLDSSIICAEMPAGAARLRTWCATGPVDVDPDADDAGHARTVADWLDTDHRTLTITRQAFAERWPALVERLGLPLGTPNEVAIHAVATAARRSVTVLQSGEGADELFAGYGPAVGSIIRAAEQSRLGRPQQTATTRLLHLISWIPAGVKDRVLVPPVLAAAERDDRLIEHLSALAAPADARPGDPRPLLGVLGRLNLAGLLARLDTATMQASIEGRTPLADVTVAMAAGRLPLSMLAGAVVPRAVPAGAGSPGAPAAPAGGLATKRVLRHAWRDRLPEAITSRPKRSFPLPFTEWVGDQLPVLRTSATARAVFDPGAIASVEADPIGHALAAWPMINLALWLRRWD